MYESLTRLIPGLIEEYGTLIVDSESNGTMDDPIRMPFVDYSPAVTELMKTVYAFKAEHPDFELTKYEEILSSNGLEWSRRSMSEADVSDADGKFVMALLMGGNTCRTFQRRNFTWILRRRISPALAETVTGN